MAEPSVSTGNARAAGGGEAAPEPAHAPAPAAEGQARRWRPSPAAALALAVGLLVVAGLTVTALVVYERNEDRLLRLRVRELNLVLAATAPANQIPLASAAELADATAGNPAKFRSLIAPSVGVGRQFLSVSLWAMRSPRPRLMSTVGVRPLLASLADGPARLAAAARRPGVLNLISLLDTSRPSLGSEFNARANGYAAYGENPLPANRRSRLESNNAFSDLRYALYLGRSERNADLLVTSESRLPLRGRRASDPVRFGSAVLTLVVAPRGALGGSFFRDLPWLIAAAGTLLALAAAALTESLVGRRRRAELLALRLDRVAAENRSLYVEQRSISQTLQHALLPDTLPRIRGLEIGARYVPAATDAEVGGDWYDVIAVDEQCAFLIIGDVSGHGLQAATAMALVRHAALAYVAEEPRPGAALGKLSAFVNSSEHDYFATVLCALIDVAERRVTLASAGHLPPLLSGERCEFAELALGPPIGVPWSSAYRETEMVVPPGSTLLAFTDGLVERRGEVLDVGLERLRDLACRGRPGVSDLLVTLARELTSEQHHDDTALVGIQWKS